MNALNNVTTANGYTRANTVVQYQTVRVNLQVAANGAIYWQASADPRDPNTWGAEELLLPGFYSFDRLTAAVRVRSAAAGVPGQVTVTLLTAADTGQ